MHRAAARAPEGSISEQPNQARFLSMRHLMSAIIWSAVGVLALPAIAQESREGNEGDAPRRPVARERIMRAFDRDNDGRLSDEELAAVREQLGDRFIELRDRIRELRDDSDDDAN